LSKETESTTQPNKLIEWSSGIESPHALLNEQWKGAFGKTIGADFILASFWLLSEERGKPSKNPNPSGQKGYQKRALRRRITPA